MEKSPKITSNALKTAYSWPYFTITIKCQALLYNATFFTKEIDFPEISYKYEL